MARTFLLIGALGGVVGVALGAFGAHGLRGRLAPDMVAVFETAVRYHMYHALALLLVSALMTRIDGWLMPAAGWSFTIGIVLFSGSLYALTPVGGVAFVLGWAFLAIAAL